jgi:Transposase protein
VVGNPEETFAGSQELLKIQTECKHLKSKVHYQNFIIRKQKRIISDLRSQIPKSAKCITRRKQNQMSMEKKSDELIAIKTALSGVFSTTQVKLLTNKSKKRVYWTVQDISHAISLHAVSSRCYSYLREKCHHPLPAISTLKRWTTGIKFIPGQLMSSVLAMLSVEFKNATPMKRIAVLGFDEVEINDRYCIG